MSCDPSFTAGSIIYVALPQSRKEDCKTRLSVWYRKYMGSVKDQQIGKQPAIADQKKLISNDTIMLAPIPQNEVTIQKSFDAWHSASPNSKPKTTPK